jgi:hypothetical protein
MADCSFDSHSTTPHSTPSASLYCEDNLTEDVRKRKPYSEADFTQLHQQYMDQIDSLEAVIQEKEIQLHRYQQTIADQACEIASLNEELTYFKSREVGNADPTSRAMLIESLCAVKIDRLYRKIRPSIVKINLEIGRLANNCIRLSEDTAKADDFRLLPALSPFSFLSDPPASPEPYSRTTLIMAPDFQEETFQRCKKELEMRPTAQPSGDTPLSPIVCPMCSAFNRQIEKLQGEIRKHKKFIGELKASIETLVGDKVV